ncbi:uncharacterized protein [Phyllobates terribilis]|uniref:uncharacterized protein n=1 Tax=Phyllobates terribilis TaxID=111132 RepID=UPI003CCAC5E8
MESQKLQKKNKKNKALLQRPHSSQQYKLDETLTDEDMLFICLLEKSMKTKEKNKKRKKKIDKTGSTRPWVVKSLSQYSQKGQDLSLDSVYSGKSRSTRKTKRKRKRVDIKSDNTWPPGEISNMSDDPFESPVKRNNKKKLVMPSKIQVSTSSPSRIENIGPAPQNIDGGKTYKSRNIEATTDPKRMSTRKVDDGISQRGRKHSLLYPSTQLSSTDLPKTKRNLKLISLGKAEDMEGMSNHSQGVFIVQKQFGLTQSCSEKPLDLSLPSRIRAKRNILSPSEDVIKVVSQSPPLRPKASKSKKVKFSFNPPKNAKDTKFIQTFLNPAYFFRRKGESSKANVLTPLLQRTMEKAMGKKRDRSKLSNESKDDRQPESNRQINIINPSAWNSLNTALTRRLQRKPKGRFLFHMMIETFLLQIVFPYHRRLLADQSQEKRLLKILMALKIKLCLQCLVNHLDTKVEQDNC